MKNLEVLDRTRERVQRLLLEEGPSTAAALSQRLSLSPAAVRRHLDAMLADGTVETREHRPGTLRRRGRGRPARVFALSEQAHARATQGYGAVALAALEMLDELGAVGRFASRRALDMEIRYGGVSDAPSLAAALTADGYASTTRTVASGTELCQHHCPVSEVAAAYPQLCDAETAALGRLLGTHVQRLATIAHGDGVCTTHIPARTSRQEGSTHDHDR